MSKLFSLLGLFRQGVAVSDPKKWKERQITATVLAGVVLAVVNVLGAFGYALPIDTETANAIAAGIIAIVNVILSITTTDKVGLPAKPSTQESSVDNSVQTEYNSKGGSGSTTEIKEVPASKPQPEQSEHIKRINERDSKEQYLA